MLQRVLFVCVGNACRSQMAEGFARVYGSDVMTPASAGIWPAMMVPVETREAMAEKNIGIEDQFPKPLDKFQANQFDLVVNMSGYPLPGHPKAREWKVEDPIGGTAETYRETRDLIESLVMKLILDLRRQNK
jgi:arsenate reductase